MPSVTAPDDISSQSSGQFCQQHCGGQQFGVIATSIGTIEHRVGRLQDLMVVISAPS